MAKHIDTSVDVYTMSLAELEKRAARALELVGQIKTLLPGMAVMSDEERRHSQGKFRDNEVPALQAVLDVVTGTPTLFQALADEDEGNDPTKLETGLIADRMRRREIFAALDAELEPVSKATADVILRLGAQVKPVLFAAYRIAKAVSVSDAALRDKLSTALNFYRRIGRTSAAARAAKATTRVAPTAA